MPSFKNKPQQRGPASSNPKANKEARFMPLSHSRCLIAAKASQIILHLLVSTTGYTGYQAKAAGFIKIEIYSQQHLSIPQRRNIFKMHQKSHQHKDSNNKHAIAIAAKTPNKASSLHLRLVAERTKNHEKQHWDPRSRSKMDSKGVAAARARFGGEDMGIIWTNPSSKIQGITAQPLNPHSLNRQTARSTSCHQKFRWSLDQGNIYNFSQRVLPVGPVLRLTKLFLPWWMVFGKELFGVLLKLPSLLWFFFFKFQIDWVSPSQLLAGLPRPRMLGLLWLSGPVWF
ncbi:hypothetical protein Nepgr_026652 [Nepenthes gracilis]|uniref:Uncharacterized protein n=1 Tax=Nepenthes gracilis TaxID=150966 RepID=A0AAD3Y2A5_NEPGR|nr:hypothetical protein Nepgr_026652 [Nepenthes gracilis]